MKVETRSGGSTGEAGTDETTQEQKMRTYPEFDDLPLGALYLGSEHGDGSMDESLADAVAEALHPARLREDDGTFSYFELGA